MYTEARETEILQRRQSHVGYMTPTEYHDIAEYWMAILVPGEHDAKFCIKSSTGWI